MQFVMEMSIFITLIVGALLSGVGLAKRQYNLDKEKELDSKNRQVSIPSETIDKNMNWRQSYKRDSELV